MSLEIENPGKILGKAFIMLQRGSTFAITFCKALKEKMVNLVLTLLFRKQFKKEGGDWSLPYYNCVSPEGQNDNDFQQKWLIMGSSSSRSFLQKLNEQRQ